MLNAFYTILEVSTFTIPFFIAALFLLRSNESYNERYENSKFKFIGFSRRQYIFIFRFIGIVCAIVGLFAIYKNYIEEPVSGIEESKDFWEKIERQKKDDPLLKTALLLSAAIAIPARMGSTRFPGKPLAMLGGKAVIERVFENCTKSRLAEKSVILTDSVEIMEFADHIGAPSIMTSEKCASGTERIIEAFDEIGAEFVVNVQGDEPFVSPALIDSIIEAHRANLADIVTAARKIQDPDALFNPNVVKVLRGEDGKSLYFSRSPLPFVRGEDDPAKWLERSDYWHHIGIYGYSAKALARYASLPVTKMEKAESLEQLRFVAAGYKFEIVETDFTSIGIDTPSDLAAAEKFLEKNS